MKVVGSEPSIALKHCVVPIMGLISVSEFLAGYGRLRYAWVSKGDGTKLVNGNYLGCLSLMTTVLISFIFILNYVFQSQPTNSRHGEH